MKLSTIFLTPIAVSIIATWHVNSSETYNYEQNNDNSEYSERFRTEEWNFESHRDEISPVHAVSNDVIYRNSPTLLLSGGGKKHANGSWVNLAEIKPERYYRFTAYYLAENVEEPWRSVLATITWMDDKNNRIGEAEFPRELHERSPEGWNIIEQIYKAPLRATKARIELIYRWDADGKAYFGDVSLVETAEPASRKVTVATVFHRPVNSSGVQDNLDQFAGFIKEAGDRKADIVLLPEAITLVGTSNTYMSVSEPVPGPTTRFLGEVARMHNLYIIAGIAEKDGDVVYNTAVLIDREGNLAGKYRKVSLPREEIDGGMTPGDTTPVFDTDFGRIGIMICWDVHFPEVARALAMQGAEIIFLPIWGGNFVLTQARAIENQVFMVTSTYDMKSAILNLEGEILVEATTDNPLVVSEVDLGRQVLWPWLGDFKNRIPREIPTKSAVTW